MENTTNKKTFIDFMKRYGYYFLLIACVLALAIIITMSAVTTSTQPQVTPSNTNAVTFSSPVLNATITKNFSNTELQYNNTLKQWEAHFAVDFTSNAGADVLACYDGTISKVTTNTLQGTVVEIDHGNGLTTKYGSLANVSLAEGTKVKTGDKLGIISDTAGNELNDGAHVHFEVWKDGAVVDPNSYLNISQSK